MATTKYFAYGSNMVHDRMAKRVPSSRVLGPAELPGYSFCFNKLSKDGSAKANIISSGNPDDVVYGVLYELDEVDRPKLDRVEGLGKGYDITQVSVRTETGDQSALTYVAAPQAVRNKLKPYLWYKNLVLDGAKLNHLPPEYIRQIEAVEADRDDDLHPSIRDDSHSRKQP
jgi:gamma-glutamylcyclotransferase (GGCT)/AIG2-like uncharacterized protein YtfP